MNMNIKRKVYVMLLPLIFIVLSACKGKINNQNMGNDSIDTVKHSNGKYMKVEWKVKVWWTTNLNWTSNVQEWVIWN